MPKAIRRVAFYVLLTAICFAIAIYWTDSQEAFVGVFATGLVIGVAAELMFWWHVLRLPWKRRQP